MHLQQYAKNPLSNRLSVYFRVGITQKLLRIRKKNITYKSRKHNLQKTLKKVL